MATLQVEPFASWDKLANCCEQEAKPEYPIDRINQACKKKRKETDMYATANAVTIAAPVISEEANGRLHLRNRLRTMKFDKFAELEKKFNIATPDSPKSAKEAIELIKAGKFTIKTNQDGEENDYESWYRRLVWRAPDQKPDQDGFKAAAKKLDKAYQDGKDTIIISDLAKGLKALHEFESATFH